MGQAARLLGDDGSLDGNLFRVGALLAGFANTEHRVAQRNVLDAVAYGADRPRKIASRDQGKFRVLVFAEADLPIRRVDARGSDVDENFARAGYRIGQMAVLQDLRSTEPFNKRCLHFTSTSAIRTGCFDRTPSPRSGKARPSVEFAHLLPGLKPMGRCRADLYFCSPKGRRLSQQRSSGTCASRIRSKGAGFKLIKKVRAGP